MNASATTWREVRDLLNVADDSALDQPIMQLGENTHRKASITVLEKPYYDDGETLGPVEQLADDFEPTEPPVYPAGTFLIDPDN